MSPTQPEMPRLPSSIVAFAAALACATARPAVAQHVAPVGGTYEIQICRTPCDPAHPDPMVRGIVVLEDTPYSLATLSDSARAYLQRYSPYLLENVGDDEADAPADTTHLNACFLIEPSYHAPTDAGIIRAAVTTWERDSAGVIDIGLFQSPDEGYVARFQVEGGALKGTGRSWAAGERAGRTEYVAGRRIGPPDRARCLRGIEAEAAREHAAYAADDRFDHAPQPRMAPAPFRLSPSDPLASILSGLLATDRAMREVRGEGTWAFDPRPVRVSRGPAPDGWPDSVAPRWLGDVRDPERSPADVARLLAELNGDADPPNWAVCGSGASPACDPATYPAVVAASEPWVQGDRAQLLLYVRDRPRFNADPAAWYAHVVFLERREGLWHVRRSYNVAGSWTR